jgi:hypothetical protein
MDPARRRQRRQRRRAWLMSVFSLITLAALVVVGGVVVRLDRTGRETAAPAGLSTATARQQADPMLTDSATGLSYMLLGSPWVNGCPRGLSTAEFRWTGGESALAGMLGNGSDWYANACSGPLPPQFRSDTAGQAAWAVANAIKSVYYSQLRHWVSVPHSAAVRVGGRAGWLAEFLIHYTGLPHLAWSSELAAVVVTGNTVFYVSVPDNLGTSTVATLLSSLR